MLTTARSLALCIILAATPAIALAQAVPDNVPDNPEESAADRERERLIERHRQQLAPLFGSTTVAVSPFGSSGATVELMVRGGANMSNGDAISVGVGTRTSMLAVQLDDEFPVGSSYLFSLGLDIGLRRFESTSRLLRRSSIGLGFGGITGQENAVMLELQPTYTIRVNQFWSLPIGIRGTALMGGTGEGPTDHHFLGVAAGIKVNLLTRDRLKLR